jgi:uncharacterized delta-60 repeat protein
MRLAAHPRSTRRRPRLEALEGRALLSASGSLDSTFGGGAGYATAGLGLRYYANVQAITYPPPSNTPAVPSLTPKSVVVEANGQVVSTGIVAPSALTSSYALAIVRDNADGTPDTTFGSDGLVLVPIGSTPNYVSLGVLEGYLPNSVATAVQADGKIIVASEAVDSAGHATFVAVRLDLDGSVDSTYGTGGIASYPLDTTTTPAADRLGKVGAALIQPDGKLVLLGSVDVAPNESNSAGQFAAVRLDTSGAIDPTYGTNGTVDVPVTVNGYTSNSLVGAAFQSDGQVVATGNVLINSTFSILGGTGTYYQSSVFRLSTSGALDTSYGGASSGGIVLLPIVYSSGSDLGSVTASGMAIQPTDGKVVVSASGTFLSSSSTNLLYRLNTDGTPDPDIGTGALIPVSISGQVAVQADGKILVANGTYTSQAVTLARFNPNGSPDPSFGPSTVGLLTPRPPITSPVALAIQPADGKILLAGEGNTPSAFGRMLGLMVDRVLASADSSPAPLPPPITQPANFDGSGQTNAAIFEPTPISDEPTMGSFVVQTVVDRTDPSMPVTSESFGLAGVGQSIPADADYLGDGASQLADYQPATGIYEIRGNSFTSMQFGVPGAGQSIPVPADYEGDGKADMAVYLTASGTFAIIPSDGTPAHLVQFGAPGLGQSIPAPADYYGTGQDDIAVYLEQAGAFAILSPDGKSGMIVPFGMPGLGQSIPVPGDYDGSGHMELAVYIPSLGAFFYRPYDGGPDVEVPFGTPNVGELPVVGDYDGSGRTEVAVYDPSRGFIAYRPALGGPDVITYLGTPNSGAIPVATLAGALPEYGFPSAANGNAIKLGGGAGSVSDAVAAGGGQGSTPSAVAGGIARTVASAVPAGPTLASSRVALARVNQGVDDTSKPTA